MNESTRFEKRKQEHIQLSLDSRTQNLMSTGFDKIRLWPNALPEINFSDVKIETTLLKNKFSSPHFISSMTAGHKQGEQINLLLAEAASEKNWLFCLGSQRKQLLEKNKTDIKSEFNLVSKIAKKFPKTKFVSNIGIEQVIKSGPNDILKLMEATNSIGLIIHLNGLQEIFQGNQKIELKNGLKSIEAICKKKSRPVIIKEVGFGITASTSKRLFDCGVDIVDVSGSGGTHWGAIESLRQPVDSVLSKSVQHFSDWGMTTVECLLDHLKKNESKKMSQKNIWASGGIRSGVDSAKCLALGASAVGLAQPLMKSLILKNNKLNTVDKLIHVMNQFDFELKTTLFCTGSENIEMLSERKVWYEKR